MANPPKIGNCTVPTGWIVLATCKLDHAQGVGKGLLNRGGRQNKRNPALFENDPLPDIDERTEIEHRSLYVLEEDVMLRSAMEEVAALTSLGLFVSMIAIWAQVIAVL